MPKIPDIGYTLPSRILVKCFKFLNLYLYLILLITFISITIWLLLNGRLISTTDSRESTLNLKLKEPVYTNFSAQDFNDSYVKPEEYQNYNRVWDSADISVQSSEEIFVFTNVIITANQTQGLCPESPLIMGAECDPKNPLPNCVGGRKMANGIETGRCVPGDFKHHDGRGHWIYGHDCEIRGWCPARRLLPPLKGYAGVLADTKNSTLWVINTIRFNDYDIDFDNLFGVDETFNNCRYNPTRAPHCPIFILGDIVKYAKDNDNQSYEEVAKFGATINFQIEWKCRLPLFKHFNSIDDCYLKYSFFKIVNVSRIGSYSYRTKFYFNNNERTHWTAYGLRIKVNVMTKLERYNIFQFTSYSMAYSGVYGAVIWGFATFVRLLLKRRGYFVDELLKDTTDIQSNGSNEHANQVEIRENAHLIQNEFNETEKYNNNQGHHEEH